MEVLNQIRHWIDPHTLVQTGYFGIALIIFAESGLLFGFVFPGDSLLLVAGILAATGALNLLVLMVIVFLAAFAGDQVGYWLGNRYGRGIFKAKRIPLFRERYVEEAEAFFELHGHKTIVLARFVPIVRTFAPIVAGVANMPYRIFVTYNFFGALLWGIGMTLVGYLLGNIPNIDKYINVLIVGVVLVSLVPVVRHVVWGKKTQK
jgi:membrane-associated protein